MRHRMTRRMSALLIGLFALTATSVPVAMASWGTGNSRSEAVVVGQKKLKRERIRGTVTRVSGQIAYVRVAPSRVVAVQLGPASYWDYHGYRLVPGQRVTVMGWYDPYERSDWFFAGSLNAPGFSLTLTNDVGVPVWVTEYESSGGWYPTYDTYEVWYRPSYRFVPPGHMKEGPRGQIKGTPPGHAKKAPPKYKKSKKEGGPRGK